MLSTHSSLASLPDHASVVMLFLYHIVPSKCYAFFSYILLLVYPLYLQAYSRNNITLQLHSLSSSMFVFPCCYNEYRYHLHCRFREKEKFMKLVSEFKIRKNTMIFKINIFKLINKHSKLTKSHEILWKTISRTSKKYVGKIQASLNR